MPKGKSGWGTPIQSHSILVVRSIVINPNNNLLEGGVLLVVHTL